MELEKVKELINQNNIKDTINVLDHFKIFIDEYADSYSKNQNIKNRSVKRKRELIL